MMQKYYWDEKKKVNGVWQTVAVVSYGFPKMEFEQGGRRYKIIASGIQDGGWYRFQWYENGEKLERTVSHDKVVERFFGNDKRG